MSHNVAWRWGVFYSGFRGACPPPHIGGYEFLERLLSSRDKCSNQSTSMNPGMDEKEWHYLVGMEVRGPVSLDEISRLLASGGITADVMIEVPRAPRLRPAGEVLKEVRAGTAVVPPPLPQTTASQRNLLDQI